MYPTTKAWSYILVTPAANLAVPLAEAKTWLKVSGAVQDDEITALIKGVTLTGEKLTGRDFVNKTYKTFRDCFSDLPGHYINYTPLIPQYRRPSFYYGFEIKKSKLQSVVSVKYLKDSVLTLVDPAVYYSTEEADYSKILSAEDQSWPSDFDNREQAVEIQFVAGYGADSNSVPDDIKLALKQHLTNAFENRGDCSESTLPSTVKSIYMSNRIMDIV